jgi:hypothetical protein
VAQTSCTNLLKKRYIVLVGLLLLFSQSCRYTKHVPEGRQLLMDNDIYVNGKSGAPGKAQSILKQQPNSGIWLFGGFLSPALGIHSWGKGTDSSFFSKLGDAPIILDTLQTRRGALQLQTWYFNNGYFNAETSFDIDTIHNNPKKARANYYVNTGNRYFMDDISMDVDNEGLRDIIEANRSKTLLRTGNPYDADVLDLERKRLSQIFRNRGYYGFNKNYIVFEADTFNSGDSVDIRMLIADRNVRVGDSVVAKDHQVYKIGDIIIQPDYQKAAGSSNLDSTHFLDYDFAYRTLRYKPRYITDAIHMKPGELYSERTVKETYAHLVNYRAFQLTEISFKPVDKDGDTSALETHINIYPLPKRTYTIEPEGTYTSGNIGARVNFGYQNRNLFRGGELFDVRLTLGFEYQPTPGSDEFSETREIGGEVGIYFPRFLLPFNTVGLVPKRMQPASRLSVSVSNLDRVEFRRVTLQTALSYQWRESLRKTHQIDLVDLAYSRLFSISPEFFGNLNPIQQRAFQSELIGGTRYTFIYNEQIDPNVRNFRYLRASVELAGNGLRLLDQATDLGETNENGNREIFGVQYFQYGKIDVDGRYYWNLGRSRVWVNRVFSGYILPYGNSVLTTDSGSVRIPPFSRYYFMGGGNDLRGWPAYRLGPGTQSSTDYATGRDTTFATGTFKLLMNSEYRFRLFSALHGAVFVDAGNIWNTGGIETPKTKLTWRALYQELAISTGAGLRLDLDFFVVRFDVGVKVRDPSLIDEGDQWVILSRPVFPNLSYHIALGYPF